MCTILVNLGTQDERNLLGNWLFNFIKYLYFLECFHYEH